MGISPELNAFKFPLEGGVSHVDPECHQHNCSIQLHSDSVLRWSRCSKEQNTTADGNV